MRHKLKCNNNIINVAFLLYCLYLSLAQYDYIAILPQALRGQPGDNTVSNLHYSHVSSGCTVAKGN